MTGLVIRWLITALGLLLIANFTEGIILQDFTTALMVVLVLGIANAVIRPILRILTMPLTIITLGLFTFVLNAFILYMAAFVVAGFHIDGFFTAIIAAFLLSLVSVVAGKLIN